MERTDIEREVISIIRDQKTMPEEAIDPQMPLAEAGIDSLDALNILFAIEEKFGITIPDEKARAIRTLTDMVDTVDSLLPSSA
ncbi:MAG TPA: phosphopantetheine-binding protein [Thermoanaerobaculia bacterium]|nr:phosphopantetheine-binding protein [Thermoanaerobaculia bacterium]